MGKRLSPLARRLAAVRTKRGLTQMAAASLAGTDSTMWSRWERGKVAPNRYTLEALVRAFPELAEEA